MRIAFVPAARLLSDRDPNGEALIAAALLRRLSARGHDLLVYCEQNRLSEPIPGADVREISVSGLTAALGRIAFARRIARDVARERIDVAHLLFPFTTHDGYTFADKAPLVCGPVNLPWPGTAARTPRFAARAAAAVTDRIERRAHVRTMQRAARILVTGRSSASAIHPALRVRMADVPFGVDTARFAPSPLPADPVILFCSVLHERKGIEVLVRAMAHVRAAMPRARLIVAGDDPQGLRPHLDGIARDLGIAAAVEFRGAVVPSDMPALYREARVVCQPSFGEPFGMTVIEAMASARPVVGTADAGIRDAIDEGRGGRLVRPGDVSLLADALLSILRDPKTAEVMAVYNRARAEHRYDLDRVVDAIEENYERAVRAGANRVAA